jgi:hypothetical protein
MNISKPFGICASVLSLLVPLLGAGCGSGAKSNPDAGGSDRGVGGSGSGGGGGSNSGTGGAGGSSGSCNPPACILSLFNLVTSSCAPAGTCVTQAAGTGFATCYSNGVKVFTGQSTEGGSIRQTKSDGTDCFTETFLTTFLDGGGAIFNLTYKNASGATIATGTSDSDGKFILNCEGQSFDPASCPSDGGSGGGGMGGTMTCTLGTCQ